MRCRWEPSTPTGQTLGHHRFGNVLHPLHDVDQRLAVLRPARREADTAIADNDGGDAMVGGRHQTVRPCDLSVIMGMNIDEAGRDEEAAGVDLLSPPPDVNADPRDTSINDGDVRLERIAALPVDDRAAPDHQISFHHVRRSSQPASAASISPDACSSVTHFTMRRTGSIASCLSILCCIVAAPPSDTIRCAP